LLKKLGAAVLAGALALTLTATGAQAYTPDDGATFNNPWGRTPEKERLLTKITRTIESAHKGSTVRIAAYSNDRKDVTDALIKAHRRGVNVRVLLNDNWTSYQTKRLRNVLGTNIEKRSYLRICVNSCRGKRGNLHSKFYLFTHAGQARNIVMFGSVNLTGYGAKTQWNDLYSTADRKVLHNFFRDVFNQMAKDRPVKRPFISKQIGDFTINVYPRYDTNESDDPIMKRLNGVRCKDYANGAGINGRTMLRINMYGWNGTRGVYLARKVAELSRKGCDVRTLLSSAGGKVVQILARNGVLIKTPDADRNNNGKIDVFTHDKYMILGGRIRTKSGWHVWTGSQNWSDRSLNGDEITVHIHRRGIFWDYRQNFNHIWDKRSRWAAGTKPTTATTTTASTRADRLDILT
jgi:phosphatidylserine/phosphatidylglycerophosphate/cardiolipin synthase-like enzyme